MKLSHHFLFNGKKVIPCVLKNCKNIFKTASLPASITHAITSSALAWHLRATRHRHVARLITFDSRQRVAAPFTIVITASPLLSPAPSFCSLWSSSFYVATSITSPRYVDFQAASSLHAALPEKDKYNLIKVISLARGSSMS